MQKKEEPLQKPKVMGLVSFRIYPTLMGGQKGVALFYQYLKEHADVLLAVSSDNQETKEIITEPVLYRNKKIYLNRFRIGRLKELMHTRQIDLVIAEHSYTGWIAWLLKKATGKPFIIHSHNIEGKRFRQMFKWWWKLYHRYESWIHRKADHSFFISEEDRTLAIKEFRLDPARCTVVTYGIEEKSINKNKTEIRTALGLDPDKIVLLFNGTLDYTPNYDAVINLIEKIDPLLTQKIKNYVIVITGNRAPEELLKKMKDAPHVFYAGYVKNVDLYYQCADLFLNPVVNDTGVKTKLIEAIANHCTAVSTRSGAAGLKMEYCNGKLSVADDDDWPGFVEKITDLQRQPRTSTPVAFYDHYSWNNITREAAKKIKELTGK